MSARRAGFTLLEVTAVVLLTGILVWFTTDFYLDLSRQSRAAVDTARHARRAVVLLDRIARDLESAVLVRKPGPVDPLVHPWLFLAESDDPSLGAQRLKFSSRGRRPRSPQAVESDVEMVAWQLARTEDGDDYQLVRWSSPRLPAIRDLSWPPLEEGDRVARGIAEFGVFLMGESGQPSARWDSSAIGDSSELPLSAEIRVSFYLDEESDATVGPFVRRVALPLRPLDLEAQLEAAGAQVAGVDRDGDGIPDDQQDSDGDGIPDSEDDDVAGGGDPGEEMSAEKCVEVAGLQQMLVGLPPEVVESFRGLSARQVAAAIGIPLPPECQ